MKTKLKLSQWNSGNVKPEHAGLYQPIASLKTAKQNMERDSKMNAQEIIDLARNLFHPVKTGKIPAGYYIVHEAEILEFAKRIGVREHK